MKTGLRQQVELVNEIQKSTKIVAVKLLRDWLQNHGYEDGLKGCVHYAVIRSSGRCMNCGIVPEKSEIDSDVQEYNKTAYNTSLHDR